MNSFGKASAAELIDARTAFLERRDVHRCVEEGVAASWLRSQAYGVDPRQVKIQRSDPLRLQRAQQESRELIVAAEPSLRLVNDVLKAEPHMVALADPNGLIVKMLMPGELRPAARSRNLCEGASWHERDMGNNGVGTALVAKEAVLITGAQHFVQDYGDWTCIGIPLRSHGGVIVGALDLSVGREQLTSHTWGWMLSIAATIEAKLRQTSQRSLFDAEEFAGIEALTGLRTLFEDLAPRGSRPSDTAQMSAARQQLDQTEAILRQTFEGLSSSKTQLGEWDRRKDQALASLSHELRNPLNAFSLLLDLADQSSTDAQKMIPLIDRLRQQATRLTRVIDDIGDVTRVKHGALKVQTQSVDVNVVVRAALELTSIERGRNRVGLKLWRHPLVVCGDPHRLEQVFVNLLTNAIKYTPPDGAIVVTSREEGGVVVICVHDSGMGIAKENLESVFEEFTRFPPASADPGGMGVGLSITRSLMRLHGGSVVAHSAGLGQGSTFEVRLPQRR